MKDKLIAAVEVVLFVAILVAVAPRAKSRVQPSTPPAQYASFVSFAAPAPASAAAVPAPIEQAASSAKAAPAPAPSPSPAPAVAAAAAAPAAAPVAVRSAAPAPAATLPAGAKQLWGVIDSVDLSARTLALKDKRGNLHSVALPADAQVTLGGENQAKTPGDLKAGDAVTVTTENGAARLIHKRLLFPQPGAAAQAAQ